MWFSFAVGSREAVNVSLIFQMLAENSLQRVVVLESVDPEYG